MKKLLSVIIILALLFLVSCAVDAPVVYNTPAATAGTVGTAATAETSQSATSGTNSTPATPAATTATTATTSTQGGTTPTTPFVPSGYISAYYFAFETRSKVMLMDFLDKNVLYYYSKADGEFYPFCFDPFCSHRGTGETSPGCISAAILEEIIPKAFYLNSRVYFPWRGGIYSCSEFATDLRVEVEFEKFTSVKDYYSKLKRGGNSVIFQKLFGAGDHLFFEYVDPDGEVGWYRYNVVSRKLQRVNDELKALGNELGVELVVGDISFDHIFMYGYTNTRQFAGGYVCDLNIKNAIKTEEKSESYTIFRTSEGLIKEDRSSYHNVIDSTNYNVNYDIIFIKNDGTVETVVKDAVNALGKRNPVLKYYDGEYFYFVSNVSGLHGYQSSSRGYNERGSGYDGNLYRYDTKTGKVDIVFSSDGEGFNDIVEVEYFDRENAVAIFHSQTYYPTGEIYNGRPVIEIKQEILKCRLDENGIVSGFEIAELE